MVGRISMVYGADNVSGSFLWSNANCERILMKNHIKKQILEEKLKKKPNFKLIRKLQQLLDKQKD